MRLFIVFCLSILTGCEAATSGDALCTGLSGPIDDVVDIVVLEGTDAVVLATERLVVKYDAACF